MSDQPCQPGALAFESQPSGLARASMNALQSLGRAGSNRNPNLPHPWAFTPAMWRRGRMASCKAAGTQRCKLHVFRRQS
eukprot:13704108-Alexandrium_andersonii.AAC.1